MPHYFTRHFLPVTPRHISIICHLYCSLGSVAIPFRIYPAAYCPSLAAGHIVAIRPSSLSLQLPPLLLEPITPPRVYLVSMHLIVPPDSKRFIRFT